MSVEELLRRQARWQQERRALTWPEKVRLAESVRASLEQFHRARHRPMPLSGASGEAASSRGSGARLAH